ncbi:TrmH family RNA methyltransferase [Maribacter aestuarii]|uniref:TrmH family RNA methyltransferase n=1 Tax=Maribacter aestuarii TaxID=1130723 RepID=UPI0025A5541C|nr:RNA methyltransferase [Maribacter aestuarii]
MQEFKHISSIQNSLIKRVVLLQNKSKERRKEGLFILEGKRELELALKSGYTIETLLYNEKLVTRSEVERILKTTWSTSLVSVSQEVYNKLAYRNTTEGLLVVALAKNHQLEQLEFKSKNPLVLVAEAPEKPGNIGALLRTADAANLDAIIIANPKTDLYNPNIIRSSVGCVFTRNIALADTPDIISFLKKKNISIYCAALNASKTYIELDYTGPSAIVVGTEDSGLSEEWLRTSKQNIIIPMEGEIDSMNVSVSAAILIFEAKRQRQNRPATK